jgi:ABC-type dipeptide/oligopeptide/nickel transport system permease subunit
MNATVMRAGVQRHGAAAAKVALAGSLSAMQRHLSHPREGILMNNLIYIVGLVVVVLAVLSFFGLR